MPRGNHRCRERPQKHCCARGHGTLQWLTFVCLNTWVGHIQFFQFCSCLKDFYFFAHFFAKKVRLKAYVKRNLGKEKNER